MMHPRADLAAYGQSLKTLRNFVVMRLGGVQSRAGLLYEGSTKANGAARLVDCVFADDQNYVLEFGDGYLRFWRDGVAVQGTVLGAWANATNYASGIVVSYSGTNYVSLAAHTSATAVDRPTTGSSWLTTWHPLTGLTYEWPAPYQDTELAEMQFAQVPGTLYIAHPLYALRKLVRTSDAVWTLVPVTLGSSGSAPTGVSATVSGTGGMTYGVTAVFADGTESLLSATDETNNSAFVFTNCTVTWNAVTGAVSYHVYRAATVAYSIFFRLGSSTTTTFVDSDAFGGTLDSPPDASGRFSSVGNYPSVIAMHQQRMLLAATVNEPDRVDASVSGVPTDFSTHSPLVDSDALSWRQVSRRATTVKHLVAIAQRLVGFTNVGEDIIQGDTNGILRPGEVNPQQLSYNGASSLVPLMIDDTALYVQARGNQVRDLVPANQDGYSGTERSRTAMHLLDGYEILAWAFQKVPHNVAWMVRSDGLLLSLTYVREEGVFGWARHDTAGWSTAGTDGMVESVTVVPEGGEDAVYLVVKRLINSATVRYIERMSNRLASTPVLMDAAVTVTA